VNELRWQLTRAQAAALAFAFAFGMSFITAVVMHHKAEAKLRHPDPYAEAGWFEMLQAEEEIAVRWNPMTGDSWTLACPGPAKSSCEWDPVEFRGETPTGSSGWYDCVLTAQGVIFWHVHTGESWILACPGTIRTCDWEPLEVRPPETEA
jgi:hypothetical protein